MSKDFVWTDELVKQWSKYLDKNVQRLPDYDKLLEQFKAEHTKPTILFRTEDGVDITDGEQELFLLSQYSDDTFYKTDESANRCVRDKIVGEKDWYIFSTNQAREAYIERNTKLFSIEDVEKVLDEVSKNSYVYAMSQLKPRIIHALKSKTNG